MNARKPAGLVLQIADRPQMRYPIFERLDASEHHRGRARDPLPVGLAHDVQPLARVRLARSHLLAHPIDEDLGAPARQRIQPGGLEAAQNVAHRNVAHLGYVNVSPGAESEWMVMSKRSLMERNSSSK